MLSALVGFTVASSPILMVVALLALAARRDHAREATVARQIRLTDAIAAEMGAIVAPVVRKRLGGRWEIEMAVPFGRPATVGKVLSIAHRVLPGHYEIRLTAQEPAAHVAEPSPMARPRLRVA